MYWKMLVLLVLPAMGMAVSRGPTNATNEDSAPNGAGLVAARKGAVPVGVGPFIV